MGFLRRLVTTLVIGTSVCCAQPKLDVSPETFDLGRQEMNDGNFDF